MDGLTLYSALEEVTAVTDEVAARGGELDAALEARLDLALAKQENRVEALAKVYHTLEVYEQGADSEIKRLTRLRDTYRSQREGLRRYVGRELNRVGLRRVDSPTAKCWLSTSGKLKIEFADPAAVEAVDDEYVLYDVSGTITPAQARDHSDVLTSALDLKLQRRLNYDAAVAAAVERIPEGAGRWIVDGLAVSRAEVVHIK